MELLRAVEKMNKLESDIKKLDDWLVNVEFNSRPVNAQSWFKVKTAIKDVIDEIAEEYHELKNKIEVVTNGLEIDHK